MSASTIAAPVAEAERIDLLDVLRALALFGILLANFGVGPGELLPRLDDFVNQQGLSRFIWDSSRPLFGFLFGLGFTVQLLRAKQKGVPILPRYLRRMSVLFMIGAIHYVLIWRGDILVVYSLTGLFLLLIYRLPPRWIGALILMALFWSTVPLGNATQRRDSAARTQAAELLMADGAEQTAMLGSIESRPTEPGIGNALERAARVYSAQVRLRWTGFARLVIGVTEPSRFLQGDVFLAFLAGLFVGKMEWLYAVPKHRRGLLITLLVAAPIVVLSNLYFDLGVDWGRRMMILSSTGANGVLTVVYVCGVSLLMTRNGPSWRALLRLRPAGRMALTNYLMQSVVMSVLYYAVPPVPDLGTTAIVLVHAAFFFGFQVPFSRWWLERYRYGPVEWVWRSLTYWKPQPMRVSGASAPVRQMEVAVA